MGVAHHSAYAPWFEMGRTELLRSTGNGVDYRQLESQGVFMAVVRLNIRYKKPARYDDVLELRTSLTSVGHVKLDHSYELTRLGDALLIATATTTLACIDREGKPHEVPAWMRPI